ncbi:MAG: hypothetical protein IJ111_02160 [Eggerthellaceae bacterium]|nr:hypothetical protein [Eggerthellaceae bacterium]
MEIGFDEIQVFLTVLLAICASVSVIGGAVALIAKLVQWVRKPTIENAKTLEEFESFLANDKRKIRCLEEQAEETSKQNKLMMKALLALLRHEINGNNYDKLAVISDEMNDYLIEGQVV